MEVNKMNLVLNHGIFGFATLHGIVYFNGVKDHLTAKFPELRILVAQVPPAGTIEVRGTELGKQILQEMQPGGALDPDEPVHIIAHSMGGLDARFLLSPDNPGNLADRIVSLTTISTPHKGSPIANLLVKLGDPLDIGNEESLLAQGLRAALAHASLEVGGLRNLATDGTNKFNEQFRDNDSTRKFSVAGVGRGKKVFGITVETCAALSLPHRIIKDETGEDNDGLVSLSSATWGTGPELWPADHADEIGHNLDRGLEARPLHFDYLAKYEALVDRLR
jgi:triacylglycerol lipase